MQVDCEQNGSQRRWKEVSETSVFSLQLGRGGRSLAIPGSGQSGVRGGGGRWLSPLCNLNSTKTPRFESLLQSSCPRFDLSSNRPEMLEWDKFMEIYPNYLEADYALEHCRTIV